MVVQKNNKLIKPLTNQSTEQGILEEYFQMKTSFSLAHQTKPALCTTSSGKNWHTILTTLNVQKIKDGTDKSTNKG
jgi:hypothetical protein